MQLLAGDADVRALLRQLLARLAQHALAKAVVLAQQIHRFERCVLAQHLHQRGQAHVGVGVKAEMPKAAFLIGQRRVYRRVVQKQHPARRVAGIVFLDGINQRGRHCRGVALQHHPRTAVNGQAQRRERLLRLALAVKALQHHGHGHLTQSHATTRINPLDGPAQIAKNRLAAAGIGAAQALDQGQLQRRGCRLRARPKTQGQRRQGRTT